MNKIWKYIFITLLLILALTCLLILESPDSNLHIIACDVGQGDSILITYKNIQVLTDGGPNNNVLTCLSSHMPFWDREIELVILTHPQKDHYFGLIEVAKRYKLDNFLYNPLDVSSQEYKALESAMGGKGVNLINPRVGMTIRLGLMQLEIVHPHSKDLVVGVNPSDVDPNLFSIVYLLNYGQFKGIFTGDMDPGTSESLASNWTKGSVNYIKVPHHGSKNGMTENLLKRLVPRVGVISVGRNNTYGHPHKEIMEMLKKYNVKTYRTDNDGEVEIVTNGKDFWKKN
ncbi:MAG: hypothetical protein Q8L28_01510 [bacterium]|nr:hypothetical protein [bacterium]